MAGVLKQLASKAVTVIVQGEEYVLGLPTPKQKSRLLSKAMTLSGREDDSPAFGLKAIMVYEWLAAKACLYTCRSHAEELGESDWHRIVGLVNDPEEDASPEIETLIDTAMGLCGMKEFATQMRGVVRGYKDRMQDPDADAPPDTEVHDHINVVDEQLGN